MNAQQAFAHFVSHALVPEKTERFVVLSSSKAGQKKILEGIGHEFGSIINPGAVRPSCLNALLSKPCFVFYRPLGFGVEFGTLSDAYEKLSIEDSWLIVLADGSAGIHRPEARWDDEKFIVA